MTFRRLIIAAAVFLLAVCWKMTIPAFREIVPAVKDILSTEQVSLVLPEGSATWSGWD